MSAAVSATRASSIPKMRSWPGRLADMAARELGMDRVETRRRNLISCSEMPYKTPLGPTYDSGDFPKILSRVQALAAHDRFELRRAKAARRGRLRGIGLACYV